MGFYGGGQDYFAHRSGGRVVVVVFFIHYIQFIIWVRSDAYYMPLVGSVVQNLPPTSRVLDRPV